MIGGTEAPWSPDPDAEEGLKARFGEYIRFLRARVHIGQERARGREGLVHDRPRDLSARSRRCIGELMRCVGFGPGSYVEWACRPANVPTCQP